MTFSLQATSSLKQSWAFIYLITAITQLYRFESSNNWVLTSFTSCIAHTAMPEGPLSKFVIATRMKAVKDGKKTWKMCKSRKILKHPTTFRSLSLFNVNERNLFNPVRTGLDQTGNGVFKCAKVASLWDPRLWAKRQWGRSTLFGQEGKFIHFLQ